MVVDLVGETGVRCRRNHEKASLLKKKEFHFASSIAEAAVTLEIITFLKIPISPVLLHRFSANFVPISDFGVINQLAKVMHQEGITKKDIRRIF